MFAYGSRTAIPIPPKLGKIIYWNQKKISERSEFRRSVLGLSPSEEGFCITEIKQDKRRAPRTKLFFYSDYRNKGHKSENIPWLRVLVQIAHMYNSVTKHGRRITSKTKQFVGGGVLQERRPQPRNCIGFECRWKWIYISRDTHYTITPLRPTLFASAGRLQVTNQKTVLGSPGEFVVFGDNETVL
jgi:hypothetical protein